MDDDDGGGGLDGGEAGAGRERDGGRGGSERGLAEGEKSCHFPTPH